MVMSRVLVFVVAAIFVHVADQVSAWGDYSSSNCHGNRVAIVHLFEWTWNSIADECERFLGPMGYCGVQVSPPSENAVVESPMRPWWERYQPVSYQLETRSGTKQEFELMVQRCNAVNVRIYVDLIINHMTGVERTGTGTGGTEYDGESGSYPGVPYTMSDFNTCDNCGGCCCINAWQDHDMVRNCRLLSLIDLNQKVLHVQNMIVDYMNRLIGYGVAGFRVDAAKHMWPEDLATIWGKLNNLRSDYFGHDKRPFMFLEVIDMDQNGEVRAQEYIEQGRVTEFRYCNKIRDCAGALWDIPNLYDPGWGMVEGQDALVFVDNHDNQRGHGAGGDVVTHTDPRKYKIAQAITLSQTYGWPRVMSSYYFDNTDEGPPHNDDYSTTEVPINEDGSCGGGWVCEHRWQAIAGMAGFAKAANGEAMANWWNEGNKAAFSRGNKAFVAITNEGLLDRTFYTGLPAGDYCNVIEGCPTSEGCSGKTVTVDSGGNARIIIDNYDEPIAAIHVEAMAGSDNGCVISGPSEPTTGTTTPGTTTTLGPTTTIDPSNPNLKRTVLFMKVETQAGQDVFILGGIDHNQRPGCSSTASTSDCAIPILHVSLGDSSHYDKYNAWRYGDSYLDWYGSEPHQGYYETLIAEGTPTAWTSNAATSPGYQPDNVWGEHYWKVEFMMDCSRTEGGWFEFKGYTTGGIGWEANIAQNSCSGTAGGTRPYSSNNHFGRCGYQNVFEWGSGSCIINTL
jgi:alpha-amylase